MYDILTVCISFDPMLPIAIGLATAHTSGWWVGLPMAAKVAALLLANSTSGRWQCFNAVIVMVKHLISFVKWHLALDHLFVTISLNGWFDTRSALGMNLPVEDMKNLQPKTNGHEVSCHSCFKFMLKT